MNIIPQISMFGDNEFEDFGDLERLQAVLSALPDEKLIRALYGSSHPTRNTMTACMLSMTQTRLTGSRAAESKQAILSLCTSDYLFQQSCTSVLLLKLISRGSSGRKV